MVKSCLLFCIGLIISNNVNARTEMDTVIITRTISNVVFISGKSLYKFTKVIQHDGVSIFSDYPIDSIYKKNDMVEKSYFPYKTRYTKVIYNYLSGTDTIKNFFNGHSNQNLNENSITIKKELKFSYILAQLGESVLKGSGDTIIRVIRPCEEWNICNSYEIFRLNLNSPKIQLYSVIGTSSNLNGIQITNKDSVSLRLKDVRRIYKLLNEINDLPFYDCNNNEGRNSWLIECNIGTNYSRALSTPNCLKIRAQKNLYLEVLKRLNAIKVKYLSDDCKEPTKILDSLTF